jgi:hypothetical protein
VEGVKGGGRDCAGWWGVRVERWDSGKIVWIWVTTHRISRKILPMGSFGKGKDM